MQEVVFFFEPEDDDSPTYESGSALLTYVRSHNALQYLVQNIRDFNCMGADDHHTCVLEWCIRDLLDEILDEDSVSYGDALSTFPDGMRQCNSEPHDRALSAQAFLSVSDSEWLAIAVTTRADVFFVALDQFSRSTNIDLFRVLSIVFPAIVERAWVKASDDGRVMFWDPEKIALPPAP